jgi:hypothetical protein
MTYLAIPTQILNAVEARMVAFGKTFQPPVMAKVRRDSDKNPRYNAGADTLPLIVITMNDDQRVEEATGLKVFVSHDVTVEWMQKEQPQERGEDEKLRLILERIRRTLHVVRIGNIVDVTGRPVMADAFVHEEKPYTLPLAENPTVNVSPQKFTYQTLETRNNTPGV